METHKNLESATAAAKARPDICCIIEIEHASEGRCYIKSRVPMANLANAIAARPMPEIRRLVAEHAVFTAPELAAQRTQELRDNCECERCGTKIDGNLAYSQVERFERFGKAKALAFYCKPCHSLLKSIGAGEYSELQERAAARNSREPFMKGD